MFALCSSSEGPPGNCSRLPAFAIRKFWKTEGQQCTALWSLDRDPHLSGPVLWAKPDSSPKPSPPPGHLSGKIHNAHLSVLCQAAWLRWGHSETSKVVVSLVSWNEFFICHVYSRYSLCITFFINMSKTSFGIFRCLCRHKLLHLEKTFV